MAYDRQKVINKLETMIKSAKGHMEQFETEFQVMPIFALGREAVFEHAVKLQFAKETLHYIDECTTENNFEEKFVPYIERMKEQLLSDAIHIKNQSTSQLHNLFETLKMSVKASFVESMTYNLSLIKQG